MTAFLTGSLCKTNKALPPQDEVTVSSSGVQLRVPNIIESKETIIINIEIADVLKVGVCLFLLLKQGVWYLLYFLYRRKKSYIPI